MSAPIENRGKLETAAPGNEDGKNLASGPRFEHTVGAAVRAPGAGVVRSVIGYFALLFFLICTGFVPQPKPALGTLPTLIRSTVIGGIAVGGVMAWLVFWLLDKRVFPPRKSK